MIRPRLVDLFCGAGGAARGYQLAGFHVTGVDLAYMPRYAGDEFIQADAMTFPLDGFDAIHASPPCRDHSVLAFVKGLAGTGYLLAETRARLQACGLPYVIENVEGADMPGSVTLCGSEFGLTVTDQDGDLRWLKRHRQFESNIFLMGAGGCNCSGRRIGGVYGNGGGAPRTQVTRGGRRRGGYQLSAETAREMLRVPWMNRDEAAQAIPPAYTLFIGEQLIQHVAVRS